MLPDADDVDTGRGDLADHGADLGGTHIQSRADVWRPTHRQCRSRPAAAGVARVAGSPAPRRRPAEVVVRAGPAGGAGDRGVSTIWSRKRRSIEVTRSPR